MPNTTPQTPTSFATPTSSDAQVLQTMGPTAAAQPTNLANEQAAASALSAPSAPPPLPAIYNEVKDWKAAHQWMANKYNKTLPANAQINPNLDTPIPAGNDALVAQYLQSLGQPKAPGSSALTSLAMGKDPFENQIELTGGKGTPPTKAGKSLISALRDWWDGTDGKPGFGDRLGIAGETMGAIMGGQSPSAMPGIQELLQKREIAKQLQMPGVSGAAYANQIAPAEAWKQNQINTVMTDLQTGKLIPANLAATLTKIQQTYNLMLRNAQATTGGQAQGGVTGALDNLANGLGEDAGK